MRRERRDAVGTMMIVAALIGVLAASPIVPVNAASLPGLSIQPGAVNQVPKAPATAPPTTGSTGGTKQIAPLPAQRGGTTGTVKLPPPPAVPFNFYHEIALGTHNPHYVTAVGGGGRVTDVIHTDAVQARAWEKFKLLRAANGPYAIQTTTGNYLTAVGGGGRVTDVIHTDATQIGAWEQLRLWFDLYSGSYAIQTATTNYLTAVGGGGKVTDAVHTDAVNASSWEKFRVWKCGNLGSGINYAIVHPDFGLALQALHGGGQTSTNSIHFGSSYTEIASFRLFPPFSGSPQVALQTRTGNYVTAVGGGGLVLGPNTPVLLKTDATQIGAWERFTLTDQGDCTYTIQTVDGWYLGNGGISSQTIDTTRRSDINYATRFRLIPLGL